MNGFQKKNLLWFVPWLLAATVLVGCGQLRPTSTPVPAQVAAPTSTAVPEEVAAATPAATPTPASLATAASPASQAPAEPTPTSDEFQIRSAWTGAATPVYPEPNAGSTPLGELPAGQLVIVTGSSDGWVEIVYADSPGAHAWLAADAIVAQPPGVVAATATPDEAPTATAAAPSPAPTAETGGTVQAGKLNVRSGPGVNDSILGQVSQGDRVEIVDRSGGWLQIVYPGAQDDLGWVSASYVAVDGEPTPVPPAATAPQSTSSGTIVFQTSNGGSIYIMDASGSGLRQLTYGFDPALSPDGRQVAFTRWDEPRGLWVINADGSGARLLTGANRARSPTWTPDGTAIVFERGTGSKQCRLTPFGCFNDERIRDVFGGQNCITTQFGTFCISDFPIVTEDYSGLRRVDVASSDIRDLPSSETARAPEQSEVDQRIVYLDRDGLAVTRDTGNEDPTRLVEEPNLLQPATFSPDGQYIYASRRSHDHWDIWRWRSDGSQETALTAPPGLRSGPVHSVAPTVSPDGRSILFLTNRQGPWELWIMNADGSNQRPFAPGALSGIQFDYDFAGARVADWGP